MNTIKANIGELRADLNRLLETEDNFADHMEEIYTLSCQLDDLIICYYQQI